MIEKLPPPFNVKGVRSFLGNAGFYRRFIREFLKFEKPLCNPLIKENEFKFDKDCLHSFFVIRNKLIIDHVIVSPNWELPLEIMFNVSDYVVGVVVGQRHTKCFHTTYKQIFK